MVVTQFTDICHSGDLPLEKVLVRMNEVGAVLAAFNVSISYKTIKPFERIFR